jgi:hypothetical protein
MPDSLVRDRGSALLSDPPMCHCALPRLMAAPNQTASRRLKRFQAEVSYDTVAAIFEHLRPNRTLTTRPGVD